MSEREQNGGNVGCFIMGMIGLIGLPLYVLSVGPVVWLVKGTSWEWLGVIYFPVGLLASSCLPVDKALQWYLGLWIN